MKRLIPIVALLLLSSTAFANSFYLGAGAGQSKVKDVGACSSLNGILDPGFSCSEDDTDTGIKIFGGMTINPNLAAELGYVDFGKLNVSAAGTYFGTPVALSGDVKAHALVISAVGTVPVANQFSLLGRIGIAHSTVDVSVSASGSGGSASDSVSGSNDDLMFGFGAQLDINKQVALRAEWERYKNVGDSNTTGQSDIDLLSASVLVNF